MLDTMGKRKWGDRMSKIKNVLNLIRILFCGYFVGHSVFVVWNHYKHPEIYAMQSAPWYTTILVDGIITLAVVLACTLIIFVLNHIEKKKKP
ncbi:MAG: hypothetical protein IJ969_02755 [Anaerotignum sp.]|nr:hypothetical protein [Anaerotignum sp.]